MAIYFWTNGRHEFDKDALRAASGDRTGGSNFDDVNRALARFGLNMPEFSPHGGLTVTAREAWDLLGKGFGLHVMGVMGGLSAYWRRWSPNFTGNHSVWMQDRSPTGASWWMDPLGRGTYRGEWMTFADFRRFTEGLSYWGGPIYVTPYKPIPIPVPPTPKPSPPARETTELLTLPRGTLFPQLAVLRANAVLYDEPNTKSGIVDRAAAHEQLPYAGFPNDHNTWRMVVRQIAMSSGPPAQQVVYVEMGSVEKFVPNPAYSPTEASKRLATVQSLIQQLEAAANG